MTKVTVKLDSQMLSQLQTNVNKALGLTATEVLTDIRNSQVVPKNTDKLEESGFVDDNQEGNASIVFHTPYARRLYWHPEYNFRTDKNPHAQGRWMDSYLPGREKARFIQESFMKFLKQLSRGLIK